MSQATSKTIKCKGMLYFLFLFPNWLELRREQITDFQMLQHLLQFLYTQKCIYWYTGFSPDPVTKNEPGRTFLDTKGLRGLKPEGKGRLETVVEKIQWNVVDLGDQSSRIVLFSHWFVRGISYIYTHTHTRIQHISTVIRTVFYVNSYHVMCCSGSVVGCRGSTEGGRDTSGSPES